MDGCEGPIKSQIIVNEKEIKLYYYSKFFQVQFLLKILLKEIGNFALSSTQRDPQLNFQYGFAVLGHLGSQGIFFQKILRYPTFMVFFLFFHRQNK